jgi:hypothetical protein
MKLDRTFLLHELPNNLRTQIGDLTKEHMIFDYCNRRGGCMKPSATKCRRLGCDHVTSKRR